MSDNTLIAAEVIAAYVTNNSIPANELPDLIRAVVAAFDNVGQPQAVEVLAVTLVPAVPIKRSVHHDYLVSLEDGKHYKTLKRHLASLGMTPDDYRTKWGLPADYAMISEAYSVARSNLSKTLGLGRKKTTEPIEALAAADKPSLTPARQAEAVSSANKPESAADGLEVGGEAA